MYAAGRVTTSIRVIGTAGHVDHGKSTLINALTGIDPDRLREERERGMTIDLGFAWLTTPSGVDIGFVDVPGHQDFIRNMLAGIGGIDAALLVIALDEGVMPQTREHLAILGLLGIDRGVVALTKRDLVDDDWAQLASGEVREVLADTLFATAPLIEVSAAKRTGLRELVGALERVLGDAPPRRDIGRPRLPVDRAFTMSGFGTVVTGTLADGSLSVGEEIELVPGGRRARIRGLQTHRRAIDVAVPGSRVAANLAGVDKDEVSRGMVAVRPGSLTATTAVALHLVVLRSASDAVAHGDEVKVHAGTAEVMAHVAVLEGDQIAPGAAGWVELRLADPLAVAVGDRVVIRRPSPSETLGGGAVADAAPVRARRRTDAVAALEQRSAPRPTSRVLAALDVARTTAEITERSGLDAKARDDALAELVSAGDAIPLADAYVSRATLEALATHAIRIIALAHRRTPLRAGAPREEVRSALALPAKRFNAFIDRLVADGRIAERGASLALPGHVPTLTPEHEAAWSRGRAAMDAALLQPPSPAQLESDFGLDREVIAALIERGDLVRVSADSVFRPAAVGRFADAVIDELAQAKTISVSRARDLTASSRKHVLPLLQFLDDQGVTRRQGDDRILVIAPDAARARIHTLIRA